MDPKIKTGSCRGCPVAIRTIKEETLVENSETEIEYLTVPCDDNIEDAYEGQISLKCHRASEIWSTLHNMEPWLRRKES